MKYKAVVLHNPYEFLDDKDVQDIFSKMMALKLRGYKAEYPVGIIPFEGKDLIATHGLICEDSKSGLNPILMFRSMRHDVTEAYKQKFPVLEMCEELHLPKHLMAARNIIIDAGRRGKSVSYDGSFTIDPLKRQDRDLVRELRHMMNCVLCSLHKTIGTEVLFSLGATYCNMDKSLLRWGFNPLALADEKLGSFKVPSYFDVEVYLMHMENSWAEETLRDCEKYSDLWKNRVEFGSFGVVKQTIEKKAA